MQEVHVNAHKIKTKQILKFRREKKKKRTDGFFSKYCCFTSPWLQKGKHFLLKIVAGLKRYQFI